jgi:hypothetical protein
MKKVLLALTVVLIIVNFVHAQDNWITYKIDNNLSVKFPTQPTNTNGDIEAHTKDGLICFVSIIGETDSVSLAKIIANPDFLSSLKNVMTGRQKGVSLGEIKSGKWNGYPCYNVDGTNDLIKSLVSFYFVIIRGKIYLLAAAMPYNHDINEKNIFFDTLKLN